MFRGLLTSFAGHALLLAWAFLSIHRVPDMIEETPAIEATIITPSELTRLKQGDPNAKELEAKEKEAEKQAISKKEAEKPKPVIEPPPTAPPPAAEPEPVKPEPPKPETAEPAKPKDDAIADKLAALPPPAPTPDPGPTPEEKKQLEDKLEAERVAAEQRKKQAEELKKAEEKKKADEKKKAEEKKKADEKKKKLAEEKRKLAEAKKKAFDPDKITALLDKTPDKHGAPRSATAPTNPTEYTGPTAGERQGNDTVLSAREADMLLGMLISQLKPCAKMPGGGGGTDTPPVNVEFRLRQDGTVEGEPVIVDRQNTPLYNIAADATIRAIKQCAPFQLPPDKYGAWSKVSLTFDWPVMLGLVQR